ncbi:uncharacterized protein [Salminus brasiliensis]|uniref:uncharacterized protein n=1 Tax=Salminus brasiliensis TaxID=930266 RepID=UPI003B82CB15
MKTDLLAEDLLEELQKREQPSFVCVRECVESKHSIMEIHQSSSGGEPSDPRSTAPRGKRPAPQEPSCVSEKRKRSMESFCRFSSEGGKPSCVSMKSDRSMEYPPGFSSGGGEPSCVSMKSDRSMEYPPVFSSGGGELSYSSTKSNSSGAAPSDSEKSSREAAPHTHTLLGGTGPPLQDSHQSVDDVLHRVIKKHKSSMKKKYESLFEGIKTEENKTLLNRIYTQLYIIEGESEGVNEEHEVLQMEKTPRRHREDTPINCSDIFKPLLDNKARRLKRIKKKKRPGLRSVLTKGIAGIGKTVSVQKFILDWAEGTANQDVDFMFILPFRELNLIKDHHYSLHGLLCDFHPEIKDLDPKIYEELKTVLIFDGLDESRIPLNFEECEKVSDITMTSSVGVLMTNLIKGELLPSALIWITCRPAAANQIPSKHINCVTEIQGFSDPQKEEYFRKRISDQDQAQKIMSDIKTARSLHIMCHIPVFCWISATVLQRLINQHHSEIPKTLTEMYSHFLITQTNMKNQKYEENPERDPQKLLKSNRTELLKLAELAFKQLMKGNVMFYEEDLRESGIDVTEASVYSGVFTEIFREECVLYQRKVYCFVHLSFQEFLAAVYVFHCYESEKMEELQCFKPQYSEWSENGPMFFFHTGVSSNTLIQHRESSDVPLDDLLKRAVDKAVESQNGHLDLFLRFLLGISLESNQRLLQGLLSHTHTHSEETIEYIKSKIKGGHSFFSVERSINLFLCLSEMKDQSLSREIQEYLNSEKRSEVKLSPGQCSALACMLLTSEEVLKELDLKKYNTSEEGYERLIPAVTVCRRAVLADCGLTYNSCDALCSALQSVNSSLKELDLRNSDLRSIGVELLSDGLKSSHCKLETLRLVGCSLWNDSCEALCSALQSVNSSLKELDLSNNDLQDSGVELLSAGLKSSHCKLETLRLAMCNLEVNSCGNLGSVLQSVNFSLKELDLSRNDLQDSGVELLSAGLKSSHSKLETLRLAMCNLGGKSCESLGSALQSVNSSLKELDLSSNDLQDSGVELLSAGLKSSHCKLKTLRLSGCMVSEEGCSSLASALKSNSSHLRELDLTYNHPGESGVKLLSDLLEDPQCKLDQLLVEHRGKIRMKPGLKKYVCKLTLDSSTTHRKVKVQNGKVEGVEEDQPYPDHPDRFEHWPQVLSVESLTGRCYWEVECRGEKEAGWSGWKGEWRGLGAAVAVSYRGIRRKGDGDDVLFGANNQSWSLDFCNQSHNVFHNRQCVCFVYDQLLSGRVAVYLDWPAGTLSFYGISSDTQTLKHIYTFYTTFTEPLYAGFGAGSDCSVCVCEIDYEFAQSPPFHNHLKAFQRAAQDWSSFPDQFVELTGISTPDAASPAECSKEDSTSNNRLVEVQFAVQEDTQVFIGVYPLHILTRDGNGTGRGPLPPEVRHHFLGLGHIENQGSWAESQETSGGERENEILSMTSTAHRVKRTEPPELSCVSEKSGRSMENPSGFSNGGGRPSCVYMKNDSSMKSHPGFSNQGGRPSCVSMKNDWSMKSHPGFSNGGGRPSCVSMKNDWSMKSHPGFSNGGGRPSCVSMKNDSSMKSHPGFSNGGGRPSCVSMKNDRSMKSHPGFSNGGGRPSCVSMKNDWSMKSHPGFSNGGGRPSCVSMKNDSSMKSHPGFSNGGGRPSCVSMKNNWSMNSHPGFSNQGGRPSCVSMKNDWSMKSHPGFSNGGGRPSCVSMKNDWSMKSHPGFSNGGGRPSCVSMKNDSSMKSHPGFSNGGGRPSCVSMKNDSSMKSHPGFSNGGGRPSCVSMKNDRSMKSHPGFSNGGGRPSCVSMKNDWSMKSHPGFSNGGGRPSCVSMKNDSSMKSHPGFSNGGGRPSCVSMKNDWYMKSRPGFSKGGRPSCVSMKYDSSMKSRPGFSREGGRPSCVSMKYDSSMKSHPGFSNGGGRPSCVSMKNDGSMKSRPCFSREGGRPSCVSMKNDSSMKSHSGFSSGGGRLSWVYMKNDRSIKSSPGFSNGGGEPSCVSMKSNWSMKSIPGFSSGGGRPSCVSMKSDRSMKSPPGFSNGGGKPSCVSMKSDRSMKSPPGFSNGGGKPSCVSMKSDRSMKSPPGFSGGGGEPSYASTKSNSSGAAPSDSEKSSREVAPHTHTINKGETRPLQQDSHQPVDDVLHRVLKSHKSIMTKKYESLFEGIKTEENKTLLNRIYTQLYIIEGESEGVNEEHEVLQMEKTPRRHREDTPINCSGIFKPLQDNKARRPKRIKKKKRPGLRIVLTKGIAGIGKTVSVQKFILDWAEEKANRDVDLMFVLSFRELNLIKDRQYSLHGLLCDFYPELKDLDPKTYEELKAVFIFDGLDESRIPLNFEKCEKVSDITMTSSVGVLMTNLIKGDLLPSALIWITCRPAAANQIPPKHINRVTEIQGFNDPQKEEYFRKRISDQDQALQIISHIKTVRSLHIMCHIPVFCWISATVLQRLIKHHHSEIPKTLTEMYSHFLITQTNMKDQKYEEKDERDPQNLLESNRTELLKLAELAFKQLMKGNVMFYEEDLRESSVDVTEASVYSGVFTEIFREECVRYQRKVYCFVHLSFQEFLAAVYVFHCYQSEKMEDIPWSQNPSQSFLNKDDYYYYDSLDFNRNNEDSEDSIDSGGFEDSIESGGSEDSIDSGGSEDSIESGGSEDSIDSEGSEDSIDSGGSENSIDSEGSEDRSSTRNISLDELLKGAVDEAVESKNGHLDLFLRFLLGLSLESNQKLLQGLLTHTHTHSEETIEYIKSIIKGDHPEHDRPLSTERSINLFLCLSEMKDQSLSREIQKYLNSEKHSGVNLSPGQCSALACMLLTSEEVLEELDLKKYNTSEQGYERLIPAVTVCRRAVLAQCSLSRNSCGNLGSALQSENSSLKELDLGHNDLQDSGVELLSAGLKSPHCKLETLRLAQCSLTRNSCGNLGSALQSENSSLKELDLGHNDLQDSGVELLSAGLRSSHCKLEILRLAQCSLTRNSCGNLRSALQSENSSLKELDLSNNDLQDSGVELLSAGLRSSHCKLEILRLSGCMVTKDGCSSLASALKSNPSHLKELDLTYNHPGESGVKLLSDLLEDPHYKLENLLLEHGGEIWMKPGLKKYACRLTLDPNTAYTRLSLSEGNRKVEGVKEDQPYPDHPDRFESPQVLSVESLTGRCYWEAECSGQWAEVAVSYRGIKRKGDREDSWFGSNDQSWSLEFDGKYFVFHNNTRMCESPFSHQPGRVGVYLDWSAGTLSFYSISPDTLTRTHILTHFTKFTEPLYAGFRTGYDSSVRVCENSLDTGSGLMT